MSAPMLKLTVYFGEADRAAGVLVSDALNEAYQAAGIRLAVLLRGAQGFGLKHHLHTDRVLTLSEDLPLVSVAVDAPERIEALLPGLRRLLGDGLVTLERARAAAPTAVAELGDAAKLTVYCGRGEWRDVTGALRAAGMAGATALLGVDGMLAGRRRRARFFARNLEVPVMVLAHGSRAAAEAATAALAGLPDPPFATLERVQLLKAGGRRVSAPPEPPAADPSGLEVWHKLTVHAGEDARHGPHALHLELVHRLRRAGAAGATSLRGFWGYTDAGRPHADVALALTRRVPVVTVVVDRPAQAARWLALVDELTDRAGLVTRELVPAFHAVSRGTRQGDLRLAGPSAE